MRGPPATDRFSRNTCGRAIINSRYFARSMNTPAALILPGQKQHFRLGFRGVEVAVTLALTFASLKNWFRFPPLTGSDFLSHRMMQLKVGHPHNETAARQLPTVAAKERRSKAAARRCSENERRCRRDVCGKSRSSTSRKRGAYPSGCGTNRLFSNHGLD